MLDIGSKITQLRKQKNWSQDDLAKEINASRAIIGKYERNEIMPLLLRWPPDWQTYLAFQLTFLLVKVSTQLTIKK